MAVPRQESVPLLLLPPEVPAWYRQHQGQVYQYLVRLEQRMASTQGARGALAEQRPIDMGGQRLDNVPDPTDAQHPVTLGYLQREALVKDAQGRFSMQGADLDVGHQRLVNVGVARDDRDAVNRALIDQRPLPPATSDTSGVTRRATVEATVAGLDTDTATTPAGVHAAIAAASAALLARMRGSVLVTQGVSTPAVLTTEQSHTIVLCQSSTEMAGVLLPPQSLGVTYTLVNTQPSPLGTRVRAQGADIIRLGSTASAAGGVVQSQTAGDYLVLVGIGEGIWQALNPVQGWTVV